MGTERMVEVMGTAAALRGEEVMTDYQFRTIIKMVLGIARKTNDVSEIIKELEQLLPEKDKEEK